MISRYIVRALAIAALVGGAAGAAFTSAAPVNEYEWMESELGPGERLPIDCDGPAAWAVTAIPSAILLVLGGIGTWGTGRRRARAAAAVAVTIFLLLMGASVPRVVAEARRNGSEAACR